MSLYRALTAKLPIRSLESFKQISRFTRQNIEPRRCFHLTKPSFTAVTAADLAVDLQDTRDAKDKYPPISSKATGYWLLATSSLVFGIVVLGGLTRLTESGLSMTEWKPVTGLLPPMSDADWLEEFTKYQESPEFKQLNSHITLDEFKFIYYMEWSHRLVGRAIGMFFILPAVYFWKRGHFSRHTAKRVVFLTGLLGLQGFIGWWMVKLGLNEQELLERKSKPTVSQYRLTTHLSAAFLMYLGVLWNGFQILSENKLALQSRTQPQSVSAILEKLKGPGLPRIRAIGLGMLVLSFATAMTGGMVAGLDAGLIYNTFPHMGDDYVPSSGELMSPVYARKSDLSDLWWRNLLENPTTVQLVHRVFATATFFAIVAGHVYVSRRKNLIPAGAVTANRALIGAVSLQVCLGITTLLYLVPIPLAAMHQAGALVLLTSSLAFCAAIKKPRPQALRYINQNMKSQLLKGRSVA